MDRVVVTRAELREQARARRISGAGITATRSPSSTAPGRSPVGLITSSTLNSRERRRCSRHFATDMPSAA